MAAIFRHAHFLLLYALFTAATQGLEELTGCVHTYDRREEATPQSGEFSTPDYPKNYPENTRCLFHFRAKPGEVVWILWGEFQLEAVSKTGQCQRDYVEIIVTDRQGVQHVKGRFCGNDRPPDLKTMQASVDIVFQSSYTKHYIGFTGTYKFVSEKDVAPPESTYPTSANPHVMGCGGFATGDHGGILTNPGYPESYPGGMDCNWVIRVDPGKQVYIKLLELELTKSLTDCSAQLQVMDGYSHVDLSMLEELKKSKQLFQFCGEEQYYKEEGQKSYMSDGNRMIIRFVTTSPPDASVLEKHQKYGKPIGFRLVWTAVSGNDRDECDEFMCKGGAYCIDKGQKICAERRKLCVHKSLVCDGTLHCAESDESDEENCYSSEIITAGLLVFVLLVLVIVAVICCQRKRNFKELREIQQQRRSELGKGEGEGRWEGGGVRRGQVPNGRNRQLISRGPGSLDVPSVDTPPLRGSDLKALPQNYHGYERNYSLESTPFLEENVVGVDGGRGAGEEIEMAHHPHPPGLGERQESDYSPNKTQYTQRSRTPLTHNNPTHRPPQAHHSQYDSYRNSAEPVPTLRNRLNRQNADPDPSGVMEGYFEPDTNRNQRYSIMSDLPEMTTFGGGTPSNSDLTSSSAPLNYVPPAPPLKPILKLKGSGGKGPTPPPKPSALEGAGHPTGPGPPPKPGRKPTVIIDDDPPPPPTLTFQPVRGEEGVQAHFHSHNPPPGTFRGSGPPGPKPGPNPSASKSVGFAPQPPQMPPVQSTVSGPSQLPGLGPPTDSPDPNDRSPSPWHYRTRPTEV